MNIQIEKVGNMERTPEQVEEYIMESIIHEIGSSVVVLENQMDNLDKPGKQALETIIEFMKVVRK